MTTSLSLFLMQKIDIGNYIMRKVTKLIILLTAFSIILGGIIFSVPFVFNLRVGLNSHEAQSTVISESKPFYDINETQSNIIGSDNSSWKIEAVQFEQLGDLQNIYFLGENIGFANSYSSFITTFYKTLDGGKSWEKISTIKDYAVEDAFFISPNEGFLLAIKLKQSSSPMENGSVIMKTIDGGKNWELVYSSVNTLFNKLLFNSDNLGVVVGRKNITTPVLDSTNLVLLTNDKGQTWSDVSKPLNQIEVSPVGQVADYATNIMFSKDKGIVVLTLRGKIYNTKNQGKTWNLISKIINEPQQTGIYRFGVLDDERFWLSGGTVSEEGRWAMVSVMNKRLGWDRYRLNGYYFSDVKFLSNNEVIACGAIVGKNNFGGAPESDKAVILFSTDSGKTWKAIYESKISNRFTSIAQAI
jgi:photosystem II stability/assembly factor-like uncharacterized protein